MLKNMKALQTVIWLLLTILSVSGCREGGEEVSAEKPPGSIVRVGDTYLTEDHLGNLHPESDPADLSMEEKAYLIRKWVEVELLYQKALERGLQNDPRVRARVKSLEKEFLADHLVFLELRELIKVSEEEIEEYFNRNKNEYTYEYRVSHILVNTYEEAEEVQELLKTRSFAWVANRHSVDPVARRGGDLGYLTKGNMIPEFESVVFGLKPGERSGIVHSDFGYHIIMLVGMREAQVKVSLADVRESILNNILMEKREKAYRNFYDSLTETADVEFFIKDYMPDAASPDADSSAATPVE